jgi:2-polyprenyl-3-methyl-5-hydroxy-6-metoxy-1,4-benzoquinol methylase
MNIDRTIARWRDEATFFDHVAERLAERISPVDPLAIRRYSSSCLRRRFNKEFRFRVLRGLAGKRILDVGCGDGSNSVLLAKLGAQVVGIDISLKSIALAERRAEVNRVTESVKFVCSPLERAEMPANYFDLIWGDTILHHLIENLELLLQRLTSWSKPGTMMLFAEPVNLNHTLRRIRFMVPVKTEGTPDERPLERPELEMVRRFLPDVRMRCFSLLGRLDRFILVGSNYERSALLRRAIVNAMACVDYGLLSLPWIRDLAGYAVIYGHVPKHPTAQKAGR